MKSLNQFINENKPDLPNKFECNDSIVFLKMKEDAKGANYNAYYKGHVIDSNIRMNGSIDQGYVDNFILSNWWYKKLNYEPSKPLPKTGFPY